MAMEGYWPEWHEMSEDEEQDKETVGKQVSRVTALWFNRRMGPNIQRFISAVISP